MRIVLNEKEIKDLIVLEVRKKTGLIVKHSQISIGQFYTQDCTEATIEIWEGKK